MMDGVLIVNKEKGYTSFDVVAKLRGVIGQKKIGHLGTLDPEAEGVLPVLLGRATKLAELLSDGRKTYRTVLYLGAETDTQDACGKVLAHHLVDCSEADIREVIASFSGKSSQLTPMYSARKVDGKKLIDLARRGIETKRPTAEIEIESIEILNIKLPRVSLRVRCSKGTYIRTLCHDIGQKLGCGGIMEELVREESSGFTLDEALPLGVIESMKFTGSLSAAVLSMQTLLRDYPERRLRSAFDSTALNGNTIKKDCFEKSFRDEDGDIVQVLCSDGGLTGLYRLEGNIYKPYIMLLPDNKVQSVREPHPSVLSIGKFDGMHVGHQRIFQEMERQSAAGLKKILFSFSEDPLAMRAEKDNLLSSAEKKNLAAHFGIDRLTDCPFTDAIRNMPADDFLENVLIRQLGMRSIVVGPDCSFGYKRSGNAEYLKKRAAELGYMVTVIPKEHRAGAVVSSTRIRGLIAEGRMEEAGECLGYPYFFDVRIGYGEHIGTAIGIPTANQKIPHGKLCPPYGVYISLLEVEGLSLPAITNIGVKPTAGEGFGPGLETHVLEGEHDLYGRKARTKLLHFLRPEMRFNDMDSLKKEVEANIMQAKSWFIQHPDLF